MNGRTAEVAVKFVTEQKSEITPAINTASRYCTPSP